MKTNAALGALILAIAATPAAAADYSFTADNAIFTGTFSFTRDTLSAFSGNLDGRVFTLANVGYDAFYQTVGGTTGGVIVVTSNLGGSTGSNDFLFSFDPNAPASSTSLTYTTSRTGTVNSTLSISTTAAVPEPATWAMMIAGFGVAGVALRRRQKTTVRFA